MEQNHEIRKLFLSMTEKIANGKTKRLNFGKGLAFFRGEIHIIKMIGDHPGIFSAEIARQMGVNRSVVHKIMLKLKRRALIFYEADDKDKKRKKIYLTEKGETAYLAHESYHQEKDVEFWAFLENINPEEQKLIQQFLEKANGFIEEHF